MKMNHKAWGGGLLIAGTAIGAGMLALPITTGLAGFFWSLGLFFFCFLFMLGNLFILMEATLYYQKEVNIISMTRASLGKWAEWIAWISFLLILYAAGAAYLSGGGSLVNSILTYFLGQTYSPSVGVCLFTALFALIRYLGVGCVDKVNQGFMVGLVVSYIFLIFMLVPHVHVKYLQGGHPQYLLASLPIVVLAFTSNIIVPSLREYFGDDIQSFKKALFWGSFATFIIYVVWECLLVGILPFQGHFSLSSIAKSSEPVSALVLNLQHYLDLNWVAKDVAAFSFFALVTSFLGVILSLFDFISDGLKLDKHSVRGRLLLLLATFFPPLIFVFFYPSAFVIALSYAGLFITILYGILPVCFVWKARYIKHKKAKFCVPGGKAFLLIMLMISLFVIMLQAASLWH